MPQNPAVEPHQCPYCFSNDMRIVASDQNRDAVVIRCARCGRVAEVDVENPNTTLNEPEGTQRCPKS